MKPRVSIILVNWNGLSHTDECLSSLKKITYPDYEVIVVDNGSRQDDACVMKKEYGDYIISLKSDKNLGFAGGCNMGIRHALKEGKSGYVLLLNNDTKVESDFLDMLVETAECDQRTGIVGGKILYYFDQDRVWYEAGKLDLLRGDAHHVRGASVPGNEAREVSFITGCMMLVRREVFQDIGLLPEEYFLCIEDVDFCYRALRAGYKLRVNPRAVISHKLSAAKGGEGTPPEIYYQTRNRIHFMTGTVKKMRYVVPFMIFFFISRALKTIKWLTENKAACVRAMFRGAIDGLYNRMGPLAEGSR